MLGAIVAAALKDVEKPLQVRVEVCLGVDERVANARLRGKIDDTLRLRVFENATNPFRVGDVETLETKAGSAAQTRQARLFQLRIVVVVEIIDADDLVAACEQALCDVITDETGCAGDEDLQNRRIVPSYCRYPSDFSFSIVSRSSLRMTASRTSGGDP